MLRVQKKAAAIRLYMWIDFTYARERIYDMKRDQ